MPIDTSPSTTATSALQGIPFSALIGGPLGAAVNAQAQSAKTTIDFIQNVGMTGPPDNRKAVQVEFIYFADGREVKLIVPLLTILPIPYLSVDEVTINFKASINASSSSYQEDSTQTEAKAAGSADIKFGWGPVSGNAHFEASYSSKKDSKATSESKYSVEYTMDVYVHAGQEDMPAGLAKVLNILGDSITPTSNKPTIQVAPATLVASDPTKNAQDLLVTATLFDAKAMRVEGKEITVAVDRDPLDGDNSTVLFALPGGTPVPTDITGKTGAKGNTDQDGTVEFTVKLVKASKTGSKSTQRLKLTFDCADPKASKIVTLIIPEFTVS